MIKPTDPNRKTIKAVGLLSGGLDSTLAAAIVRDAGAEVHGIHFNMPWEYGEQSLAKEIAESLGIRFITMQLDEDYLKMARKPKHGYGTALNPCIDCHIYMLKQAREYMEKVGAAFVFTGEVLGQRPMSQMRATLALIEKESGLTGRLLRPLCARLLDPTIAETSGLIDRDRLLGLNGRSRSEQFALAKTLHITKYKKPGGGCLLADKNFGRRMKDAFTHGYKGRNDIISLQWGRHFRISGEFKAVLGRDEKENESLRHFAHGGDLIFELPDKRGPTLVLKGENPDEGVMGTAAYLVQRFSKRSGESPVEVNCWPAGQPEKLRKVRAVPVDHADLATLDI